MDKQTALQQMVAPGQKRPNIWRNGVIQVWITRACDMACFGCTQGSNLAGKPGMISVPQFEEAIDSLRGYFGVVGIFGGNPALHPQFVEICDALRKRVIWKQRGLWCNNPRGKGAEMRKTFNPAVSNLNVHLQRDAYDQFVRDWPESRRYLKGLDPSWPEAERLKSTPSEYAKRVGDARHSPPYVAMQDIDKLPFPDGTLRDNTEENRWELISNCDINKHWSAILCVFRNQLRAYFCEIAGAQAMLHQFDETYPDLGMPVTADWWRKPMSEFEAQASYHCHRCGIPLRGYGDLAVGGTTEQVSQTHADIFKPKQAARNVQLVQLSTELSGQSLNKVTSYIENGSAENNAP